MARVRYARSPRDLEEAKHARRASDEGVVRLLRCRYETDPEAVAAVVPRPLEALAVSEVEIAIASRAGEAVGGHGAMVGVRVDYDGCPGVMPLVMPGDDEARLLAGRERFGEPGKRAVITLESNEEDVSVEIVRRDVPFLRVSGRRVDELPVMEAAGVSFTFKAFPAADPSKDFDHDPQLVRSDWRIEPTRTWRLSGGVELWESPFDPIAYLPVRRLVGMEYAEGRYVREARVLRPVPGDWLLPYLHQRDDAPGIEGVDV